MMWRGVFPYLVTPLQSDDKIDAKVLRHLVRHVIDGGVHGITPLGSSGEFPYLSERMRKEVILGTIDAAAGDVPVVVGVGGFSVRETVRQAEFAASAGADGLLCILQAYFPLSDDEVIAYFRAVASSTELPIVIYNHPAFCHVPFSLDLVESLATIANVSYMKDSTGSMEAVMASPRLEQAGMQVFTATAMSPTAALLFGAVGWMSGPAGLFPRESVALYEYCNQRNWAAAREIERAMNNILVTFRRMNPVVSMKSLFLADGWNVGLPSAPLAVSGQDFREIMRDARKELESAVERAAKLGVA